MAARRPHLNRGAKVRAVLDTNIFVSGVFGRGSLTAALQDLWIVDAFVLVTSPAILREVAQVLYSPMIQHRFRPRAETIRRFFHLVFRKAVITHDSYTTDRLTSDPTDNKFLGCALEGHADYIVSRDPHLLNLKHFHGIQIVEVPVLVKSIRQHRQNT